MVNPWTFQRQFQKQSSHFQVSLSHLKKKKKKTFFFFFIGGKGVGGGGAAVLLLTKELPSRERESFVPTLCP